MPGVSRYDFPAMEWHNLDAEIHIRNASIVTNRNLDPGLGIDVIMPGPISYHGKYLGRGESKVAFELDCPGACFHGEVLKIAKTYDLEPSVFIQTMRLGLTTDILYNCIGKDCHSHRAFHCWITDRTIPLDVICAYDATIKSKCCLAAFCCILRAAHHGLYLSDCGFYNFGVIVSKDAKEHVVVIIDAGSRKISTHPQLKHSEMNLLFMRKFWVACRRESAVDDNIVHMWQNPQNSYVECLRKATDQWQAFPILTKINVCTVAILRAIDNQKSCMQLV